MAVALGHDGYVELTRPRSSVESMRGSLDGDIGPDQLATQMGGQFRGREAHASLGAGSSVGLAYRFVAFWS